MGVLWSFLPWGLFWRCFLFGFDHHHTPSPTAYFYHDFWVPLFSMGATVEVLLLFGRTHKETTDDRMDGHGITDMDVGRTPSLLQLYRLLESRIG